MALLLRVCAVGQKRACLKEFANLTRSVMCIKHHENNTKRFAPVLQLMQYSTNRNQKNDDLTDIYSGPLSKQIRNVKLFSLATSLGTFALQPMLYLRAIEADSMAGIIGICAICVISGIMMPLLINSVTKKYVLKLYYDSKENKYICKTYTLFLRKKEIKFTPDDVVVPDVTGMFTTCLIKGQPIFFDNRYFNDSTHYVKIMGYDKPVDLKLGDVPSENDETILKVRERKETENVR